MSKFIIGFALSFFLGGLVLGVIFYIPKINDSGIVSGISETFKSGSKTIEERQKSKEEVLAESLEKSKNIKGLYMTADVASDRGTGATRLRNHLITLATSTEINGLVIDVKEVCGPDYDEEMIKKLIATLHENNIWAIARIVAFKDHSQIEVNPEWYLKRKSPIAVGNECWNKKHLREKVPSEAKPPSSEVSPPLWRDKRGGYWLDPASEGARDYILEFSKKMIDLGFDELQYDYVRFPSDGDVKNIIYPAWDGKTQKYEVMKSFFEFLNKNLKNYKPDIILSADLFGYAAIRAGDVGIGQRLDDIGDNFDYISFMVYPSHYYSGFYLPADPLRNLPALNYNVSQSRSNPQDIVGRSLAFARDFLDGKISSSPVRSQMPQASADPSLTDRTSNGASTYSYLPNSKATTTATTSIEIVENPTPRSKARLRPWLEDFFHEDDKASGRPYGVKKVHLQIDAAEEIENHGWLLWNAANIYTEEALKTE